MSLADHIAVRNPTRQVERAHTVAVTVLHAVRVCRGLVYRREILGYNGLGVFGVCHDVADVPFHRLTRIHDAGALVLPVVRVLKQLISALTQLRLALLVPYAKRLYYGLMRLFRLIHGRNAGHVVRLGIQVFKAHLPAHEIVYLLFVRSGEQIPGHGAFVRAAQRLYLLPKLCRLLCGLRHRNTGVYGVGIFLVVHVALHVTQLIDELCYHSVKLAAHSLPEHFCVPAGVLVKATLHNLNVLRGFGHFQQLVTRYYYVIWEKLRPALIQVLIDLVYVGTVACADLHPAKHRITEVVEVRDIRLHLGANVNIRRAEVVSHVLVLIIELAVDDHSGVIRACKKLVAHLLAHRAAVEVFKLKIMNDVAQLAVPLGVRHAQHLAKAGKQRVLRPAH